MEWDSINSIPSFLLTGLSRSGVTTSYEYDINGRRTKKVANGVTTEYYYSGEQYTGMHTSDGKDVGAILDASGGLYGIYYDDSTIGTDVGQTYYFVYNGQGDVIGLYNHGGKLIATYAYDAWGRCIEAKAVTADDDGHAVTDPDHIAFINPFRYRGYMYDAETGFYLTGTRYYDPVIGRFINADNPEILMEDQENLLQYNLFAYCWNNPVNMIDPTGESPANIIGGISGGVSGAALGYLLADALGLKGWKKWALISAATVGGAVLGAFLGPYVAKLGSSVAAKLGIRSIPKLGSQIGRLGKLVKNTKPAIRGLTRHGLQRMAQRGVSQSMAKSIVRSGHAIAQSGGKTLFFTQAGVVVLNKAGEVVTAYSSKFFDAAMKEIIRQFYG